MRILCCPVFCHVKGEPCASGTKTHLFRSAFNERASRKSIKICHIEKTKIPPCGHHGDYDILSPFSIQAPVAQLDRVSDYESEGYRFDSCQARHFRRHQIAGWSSLVARQAHNLKVVGSNPAPATNEDRRRIGKKEPVRFLIYFPQ